MFLAYIPYLTITFIHDMLRPDDYMRRLQIFDV